MFSPSDNKGLDALLHRPPPTSWQKFRGNPILFLIRHLSTFQAHPQPPPPSHPITIICISDTHNTQPTLPPGDILIHAGDLTNSGTLAELQSALTWLRAQPHPHKILVAGNHDRLLDSTFPSPSPDERHKLDWKDLTYLSMSSTTIAIGPRTLKIHGSPLTPRSPGTWGFQYPRAAAVNVWSGSVPEDVDVLVTHGPPRGHLDHFIAGGLGKGLGDDELLREVWRVRPRLHVFGHVHAGYGREWLDFGGVQAAWERAVREGGGVWNLVRVVGVLAWEWILMVVGKSKREGEGTLLVNAAMVGGLRNEERREPAVVVL